MPLKIDPHFLEVCQDLESLVHILCEVISNTSRDHRFTIGGHILSSAWELHSMLTRAGRVSPKVKVLGDAVIELDVLRAKIRVGFEIGAIPNSKKKQIFGLLKEVGDATGGWFKREKASSDKRRKGRN